jgi:hypothetical protein
VFGNGRKSIAASINERKRNWSSFEARIFSTPEFVGFKVWETLHEALSQGRENASKSRTPRLQP